MEHVTGLRVTQVLAELRTAIRVRKKPLHATREAFAAEETGETHDAGRGEPDRIIMKDPELLDPSIRHYAALPFSQLSRMDIAPRF